MKTLPIIFVVLLGCAHIQVNPGQPSCKFTGDLSSPDSVVSLFCDSWEDFFGYDRETLAVILLNENSEIIANYFVSGSKYNIRVDNNLILKFLNSNIDRTSKVIMMHNHPDFRTCYPSNADLVSLEYWKVILNNSGVEFYDFVIYTPGPNLYSARSHGYL